MSLHASPAVVSALRPAVKDALHLIDDDLDHAAFDLYITEHPILEEQP